MKKIILLFALVLSSALYKVADAQVGINVNIGSQPVWGPTGYDYAEYYYFPDMDVYYNVPDRQFVYFDRGSWISAYSLPSCYSNYDLYNSYKVVINEPRPYLRNDFWRSRYSSYRGRTQQIIYNSRDPRYYIINEHPEHARWMASRSYNNGRAYDNGRFNDGRFNDGRFNDNRAGNFGRNDDRRFDNNQRSYDMSRNDRGRNDVYRGENMGHSGENRRGNEQRDNGRWNGGGRRF